MWDSRDGCVSEIGSILSRLDHMSKVVWDEERM
jgi:hypothetical protein